jgi:hypothetical protein
MFELFESWIQGIKLIKKKPVLFWGLQVIIVVVLLAVLLSKSALLSLPM